MTGRRAVDVVRTFACALSLTSPLAAVAVEPPAIPSPAATASPAALPLIGRVRAVTPFCRRIVGSATGLADGELADITTITEALRVLAYAPLDIDVITERRAVRILETLTGRLMESRRGAAKTYVADLRKAARGVPDGEPTRPELARFAGALDGAHSESSRVAHEISSALSLLDANHFQYGTYSPDFTLFSDQRFARASAPVPFPVDPAFERFAPDRPVGNGPLHAYARSVAYDVAASLDRLLGSVDEARRTFPTAFVGCTDVDATPTPVATGTP